MTTSPTSTPASTSSPVRLFGEKKEDVISVHTLCNKVIKVSRRNIRIISELKDAVCSGSYVSPDELAVVSQGTLLDDDQDISYFLSTPLFAYVKCSASRDVSMNVKNSGLPNATNTSVQCSLNMNIKNLKNKLFKDKITDFRPSEQRAIIGGRVLKDHTFLGDYLLHSKKGKSKASQCTIVISKTLNPNREIDIVLEMPNSASISFAFPIGETLYYAKNILRNQFGFPSDAHYSFEHKSGVVLRDCDTLLDRGLVSPSTKKVNLTFSVLADVVFGPNGVVSLPLSLLGGASNSRRKDRSQSTGELSESTTSVSKSTENDTKPKSLFQGMKKGFLSGSKSSSSVTVKHPAVTTAAARKSVAPTKDIWTTEEIPTEAELLSGIRRRGVKRSSPMNSTAPQKPVRKSLHSRFARAIAIKEDDPPQQKKDKVTGSKNKSDSQPEPTYNICYMQHDGAMVKSFSPDVCTHVVIKIHLPQSKLADLDLNVTMNKIKVASQFHQLVTPLLVNVQHRQVKAKFDSKKEILTVTLPVL